ncbi:MAG: ATP-binding cassette domain-containing protein [Rhizobiaceae bacterium]|nr:ATP-binding cassette domain-containing protein [Rhizobiaceae bacterium]
MLLSVKNLKKSFITEEGTLQVLRGVDLELAAGERLALTGESGCGKSTLLYLIGALESFDAGEIWMDGVPLGPLNDRQRADLRRTSVGIVFQQFNLIPSMTVAHNLRFHARLAGREDADWINQLSQRLGLTKFLKAYPEQLSGGQQQRVAIGRTLAARPKLILADEPTGNLDEKTSDQVITLMLQLVEETGAGLLVVTHSSRLAERMDRSLLLTSGLVS